MRAAAIPMVAVWTLAGCAPRSSPSAGVSPPKLSPATVRAWTEYVSQRCTEQPPCSDCNDPQDMPSVDTFEGRSSKQTAQWIRSQVRSIIDAPHETHSWALWMAFDGLGDDRAELADVLRELGSHEFLDWDSRHRWSYAAWDRLAELGDRTSIPVLRSALQDDRDWTRQAAAAKALGRFGTAARETEPELRRLSEEHWSSVVRAQCEASVARVLGHSDAADPTRADLLARDPRYPFARVPVLTTEGSTNMGQRGYASWSVVVDGQRVEFDSDARFDVEVPEALSALKLETLFPRLPGIRGWREHVTVARRLAGGWLLGTNAGEFGGDVWWVDAGGTPRHLLHANAIDVVAFAGSLHLLTGLSHLGVPDGALLRVEETPEGVSLARGVVLPGTPYSHHVGEGRLYVPLRIGVAVVDEDYSLQLLPHATRRDRPSPMSPEQRGTLERMTEAHRDAWQTCLEPLRRRTDACTARPIAPGVGLWFEIDAKGRVSTQAFERYDDRHGRPETPEVAACLAEVVRSWHFERPRGGWTMFGYVFEASPPA